MRAKFPLAVDLDGTLVITDLGFNALGQFIFKFPHRVFLFPFWLARGRAYLKSRLAESIQILPQNLIYNEAVIDYIKRHKKSGHKVLLVTGSDERYANIIAEHTGLFDQVIASDGRTNNVSHNKAERLSQMFGENNFIYIGNSTQDLAVWRKSAHAVATNASPYVIYRLKSLKKSYEIL